MPTLYDITQEFIELENTIIEAFEERGDLTSDEQAIIDDIIDDIAKGSTDKLEGYAKVMLGMKGQRLMVEAEAKRLTAKAKSLKSAEDRLKEPVKYFMEVAGLKKKQAGAFTFTVCGNGGKTPLLANILPEALPEKYQVVRIEPNNDAIRKDLEDGQVIEGMELGVRGSHVRVR
jgi:hypothetical protein